MVDKKHIGIHLSFKLDSWEKKASGLTVADSGDWTLLINNPVDYVCDGFLLVNGSSLTSRTYKINDDWIEKLLRIKAKKIKTPKLNLDSASTVLKSLKGLNKIIGIWRKDREVIWIGKINNISKDKVTIRLLSTHGNWLDNKTILFKDITVIEFDSDYISTLSMLVNKTSL